MFMLRLQVRGLEFERGQDQGGKWAKRQHLVQATSNRQLLHRNRSASQNQVCFTEPGLLHRTRSAIQNQVCFTEPGLLHSVYWAGQTLEDYTSVIIQQLREALKLWEKYNVWWTTADIVIVARSALMQKMLAQQILLLMILRRFLFSAKKYLMLPFVFAVQLEPVKWRSICINKRVDLISDGSRGLL